MDLSEIAMTLGGFCAALLSIGAVVRWLLKNAVGELTKTLEDRMVQEDLARTKRDAVVDNRFSLTDARLDHIAESLRTETVERHGWEQDLERRKAHTMAHHEQQIHALERRIDTTKLTVEENTRRIIALEEAHKGIEKSMVRIEEAIKAALSTSQQQFDQVCESIREMSQRSVK